MQATPCRLQAICLCLVVRDSDSWPKDASACGCRVEDGVQITGHNGRQTGEAMQEPLNDLTATIAAQLDETEPGPIMQIRRVLRTLGPERTLAFVQQTLDVEARGGMMLPDGSRRRTLGGVFFHLVRGNISWKEAVAINRDWVQWHRSKAKTPATTQQEHTTHLPPAPPPFLEEDRGEVIQALKQQLGEVRNVKITLIGRPGRIVERQNLVITTMQSTKAPALPKGVPAPPPSPTNYMVYIAAKQWKTVADAIADPDDSLIVEGYPAYDPELEGLAVYALSVTTKKLQIAKRQATQPTP